jgi:hypothetical protein
MPVIRRRYGGTPFIRRANDRDAGNDRWAGVGRRMQKGQHALAFFRILVGGASFELATPAV